MEENLRSEIDLKNQLMKVTPLSKYLALILFIVMPFIGGYIGYVYAPVKVGETEKNVHKDVPVLNSDIEKKGWDSAVCKGWSSPSLSASERFECKKEISEIVNTSGYSRFSYYPDKIILSGTYIQFLFDENDEFNFWTLPHIHFLPDVNEFNKLPVSEYIDRQKTINFRNYAVAQYWFEVQNENYYPEKGFCTVQGKATIEISEIVIDNFEGGVPLSFRLEAQLDKVIEKTPYAITCDS